MMTGRVWLWIFLAALVVRVGVIAAFPEPPVTSDAAVYERLALGLTTGQGYVTAEGVPTAERPPLYTVFLAGLFWLFGHQLWIVYVMQGVIDAGTCVLIYLLGRRLLGAKAGLIAAVLAVPYLSLIAATRMILTETLFLFLMVLSIWWLTKALEQPRLSTLMACGITLGLATLTRAVALLFPVACGVAFVMTWGVRKAMKRWAILVVCFALVLMPWALRNWHVFHAVIPVATQGGKVLYSSYRPPRGEDLRAVCDRRDDGVCTNPTPGDRGTTISRGEDAGVCESPSWCAASIGADEVGILFCPV